jgi:long-chain acyl-CoA synthetase
MVVGEGEKMPAALIQPNFVFIKEWAKRKSIQLEPGNEALSTNENVISRIQHEINNCNLNFGKWEQIKTFKLTSDEWNIEKGHLTPTLKMKRKIIKEIYKDLYESLYGRS